MQQDHIITEPREYSINIQPPPFIMNNPRVWFIQLECFFKFRRITSQHTMFSHVVSQLPGNIASEVVDLLDPPPTENPYDAIKYAIIKRTSTSDEANLRQLLSGIEIGDRTPSQLLRHMHSLVSGKTFEESVLKELWTQCLPLTTRQILATQSECNLASLADTADKIHECFPGKLVASTFREAPQPACTSSVDNRLTELETQVQRLSSMVKQLCITNNATSTGRHRSLSRRFTPSPVRNNTGTRPTKLCYYHSKFKDNAKKCVPPCYFSSHQGNSTASQ